MSKVNHEQRAAQIWPILAESARAQKTITYKGIEGRTGIYRRVQGVPLGHIMYYCLDARLLPLTIVAVQQDTGRPGPGFTAWDIDDFDSGFRQVCEHDWASYPNPFAYTENGDTREDLSRKLVHDPGQAEDVYALVKVRGQAQTIFRQALLEIYGWSCAFCGLTFPRALHAAHIVPWSDCGRDSRMNPRNGILLCAIHHALFDAHQFCITEDYRIEYCDPTGLADQPYSAMDKLVSLDRHGGKIRLPKRKDHWPDVGFIRSRQEMYREANKVTGRSR